MAEERSRHRANTLERAAFTMALFIRMAMLPILLASRDIK
jgi:hypothetical protein